MPSFRSTWSEPVPKMSFVRNTRIIAVDLNVGLHFHAIAGRAERISFR
ncbi:hypothetical protein [Gimesia algae]|nr:hypothetical protein [Gimesia algae]